MKASDVEARAKAAFGPQTEYRETSTVRESDQRRTRLCEVVVYGRPKLSMTAGSDGEDSVVRSVRGDLARVIASVA